MRYRECDGSKSAFIMLCMQRRQLSRRISCIQSVVMRSHAHRRRHTTESALFSFCASAWACLVKHSNINASALSPYSLKYTSQALVDIQRTDEQGCRFLKLCDHLTCIPKQVLKKRRRKITLVWSKNLEIRALKTEVKNWKLNLS